MGKSKQVVNRYIPFVEYIQGNSVQTSKLKQKLIREGIKEHVCERCGNTMWHDEPIALEVHHRDGDRSNNSLDNLQLLCPNCHAMTDNWRGKGKTIKTRKHEVSDEDFVYALRNSDSIRKALLKLSLSAQGRNYDRANALCKEYNIIFARNYCVDCKKEISSTSVRCKECENQFRRKEAIDDLPVTRQQLKQLIRTTSFLQIGKIFHVSDNAIRKWCRNLDLPCRSHDIKKYSDQEWMSI